MERRRDVQVRAALVADDDGLVDGRVRERLALPLAAGAAARAAGAVAGRAGAAAAREGA